jgi:hypothetical protein
MRTQRASSTVVRLILACVLCALSALVIAPSARAHVPRHAAGAKASKSATFGIGPANAKGIDGRPYLSYVASPGAHLTDLVAVQNYGGKPLRLRLYAVDAANSTSGAIVYKARTARQVDAGSWFTVGSSPTSRMITIAARHSMVVRVRIVVPHNAQPGDHAAGVIASLTSKVTSKSGQRVDFEQRVALRAYFRISGTLSAQLAIENLRAKYSGGINPAAPGSVAVSYTVVNRGNVRLGAGQEVDVSGLFGSANPSVQPPTIPLLLPGAHVQVSTTISHVWPLVHLTAHVRLKPLLVTGDVDPRLPPQFSKSTGVWAIPWSLIVLVAVLVVVAFAWRWRRRRTRARSAVPASEQVVAPRDPQGVSS